MIKRYLQKRNNPWELLLLAFVIFISGLALLLQTHQVTVISRGYALGFAVVLYPLAAHMWGCAVVAFSLLLVVLYIYALRSIAHDGQAPPPRFLESRD